MNEADTCREFVVPRLLEAGWDAAPHSIAEQRIFTDGRVYLVRGKPNRGKQKKADYLLRYTRDFPIAVVEAKADYKKPDDGLAQAKDYAQTLDLKFAYSTNGTGIIDQFLNIFTTYIDSGFGLLGGEVGNHRLGPTHTALDDSPRQFDRDYTGDRICQSGHIGRGDGVGRGLGRGGLEHGSDYPRGV